MRALKAIPNALSLSRMRYLGALSHGNASVIWRASQSAVGFCVTANHSSCRRLSFEEDEPLVFEHACLLGCEGIVSKQKRSRYGSGRSRDLVKSKNAAARLRSGVKPKRIGASRRGDNRCR